MDLGPQFIPQEWHDWAWEATRQPDLDRSYGTKTGEPHVIPGHLHFDSEGNPHIASGACSGRHACPPATQKMRQMMAIVKWEQSLGLHPPAKD